MYTVLNDYFLSVFIKDVENVTIPQQMFHGTETDSLLDIVIKKDMVQHKLEELNWNKNQGPDEIHPRLLKELSSVIADPLAKLLKQFVDTMCCTKLLKRSEYYCIIQRR